MRDIPHSRPWITAEDEAAVGEVLRTGWLSGGQRVVEFEEKVAGWFGSRCPGVATGTGAAAMVLALEALGCGVGTEVVVPTYNCPSVLEAIVACGSEPILADAGSDWLPNAAAMLPLISKRTRAVIVPHLHGVRADVGPFLAMGVPVIEDLAQIFGSPGWHSIQGSIAVFSFHPTKCFTTGEGGLALSCDRSIAEKLRILRDGNGHSPVRRVFSPMSEPAAALGLSQLARYPEMLARRAAQASTYFSALDAILPDSVAWLRRAPTMFYRMPLRITGGIAGCQSSFLAQGIHVRRGVDRLLHRWLKQADEDFPNAVRLWEETVSLPLYPALTTEDLTYCARVARQLFGHE